MPLRLEPGMIGHCVCRSRWMGKSTTPKAVPEPGCSEVWAWRKSNSVTVDVAGVAVVSAIGPHSFQVAAPALRPIFGQVGQSVGQVVGKRIEKIHAARRGGEAIGLGSAAGQVPAGNGNRSRHSGSEE